MLKIDKIRQTRTDDYVAITIRRLVSLATTKTILVCGADGYFDLLFSIAQRRFNPIMLTSDFKFLVNEHSKDKYNALVRKAGNSRAVKLFNYFPVDESMTRAEIQAYYSLNPTRRLGLALDDAVYYGVEEKALTEVMTTDGIATIKDDESVIDFDVLILDGTYFTSERPFDVINGAKHIFLFDINTIKNGDMYKQLVLQAEAGYTRIAIHQTVEQDNAYNNGYGVAYFKLIP